MDKQLSAVFLRLSKIEKLQGEILQLLREKFEKRTLADSFATHNNVLVVDSVVINDEYCATVSCLYSSKDKEPIVNVLVYTGSEVVKRTLLALYSALQSCFMFNMNKGKARLLVVISNRDVYDLVVHYQSRSHNNYNDLLEDITELCGLCGAVFEENPETIVDIYRDTEKALNNTKIEVENSLSERRTDC